MDKKDKIYIAGHRRMVGSAIKELTELGGTIMGRMDINKLYAEVNAVNRDHKIQA